MQRLSRLALTLSDAAFRRDTLTLGGVRSAWTGALPRLPDNRGCSATVDLVGSGVWKGQARPQWREQGPRSISLVETDMLVATSSYDIGMVACAFVKMRKARVSKAPSSVDVPRYFSSKLTCLRPQGSWVPVCECGSKAVCGEHFRRQGQASITMLAMETKATTVKSETIVLFAVTWSGSV